MNLLEFFVVCGVVWCPVSRSHLMDYGCHGNSWASTNIFPKTGQNRFCTGDLSALLAEPKRKIGNNLSRLLS